MIAFEIAEQESGKYLVYYKKETDEIDSLIMGMMANNKIEGTVPFVEMQMDNVIMYRYEITNLQSLPEYFCGITAKNKVLSIIEKILEEKEVLEEYMLDMEAVVLEYPYLFVHPETGEVKFVLLPIKHEKTPMDLLFKQMFFSIQYNPAEDTSYVTKILNYFNGTEPFSFVSFKRLIDEVKKGSYRSVQPAVEVPPSYEKKPAMPTENTTILDNPGTTILENQDLHKSQEYQKHYTNPNLSKMMEKEHSPSVYEPKTYPGTVQKPQEQQEVQQKEAPTPEKKKFSLFAKKEKKEPAAKGHEPIGTKPKSFHGIAIPGSDVMPKQENDKPISETAIPAQNVSMPIHNAPIQNFGETVDLKTYAGNVGGANAVPVSNPKKICLLRKATKEQFFLTKEMTKIGRSRENVDIYITGNTSIGRIHAVLYLNGGKVYVQDQNSKNGTFLNGRRVVGQEEVLPGMRLGMSDEEFEIILV